MTVPLTYTPAYHTGNGVTTTFPFTFRILEASHLEVLTVDLDGVETEISTYTVTGVGSYNGGSVILPAPLTDGWHISIKRRTTVEQGTEFRGQRAFFEEIHEDAADRAVMILQEQQEQIDRAFLAPRTGGPYDMQLPRLIPGYALGANAEGTGLDMVPNTGAQQSADLADTTSATKGAGKIGFLSSLAYAAGTVGSALKTLFAFVSDLAASSGSSLVGFIQAGTGAVARTVLDRLRDRVSVLDYMSPIQMANPSTVDCTSAFTNALATGKRVYIPAGTYMCSFAMATAQRIYGDGERRTILIPPPGATSVILIDASSVAKQFCEVSKLSIQNPNAVASCNGIWFKGINVNSINDYHHLDNVSISGFDTGIKTTGRMIWCSFYKVECFNCNQGWNSGTGTDSFNANTFIDCRFTLCQKEGFYHAGTSSVVVKFVGGCVESNNLSQTPGIAGMYLGDARGWEIDTVGFEENGNTVPVDNAIYTNNSYGIRITGTTSSHNVIRNCYITGSGIGLLVDATTQYGGKIEMCSISSRINGYAFYGQSSLNGGVIGEVFEISANNHFGTYTVYVKTDVNGQQAFAVEQTRSVLYLTSAQTLNLMMMNQIDCNTTSGNIDITQVNNRIPGCTLLLMNNYGANNVTLAGALIKGGSTATIAAGASKRFLVLGGPNTGKFVEIT